MSSRFRGICRSCEHAYVSGGGVALSPKALTTFLSSAGINPDKEVIEHFIERVSDQIIRNTIQKKRRESLAKGALSGDVSRKSVLPLLDTSGQAVKVEPVIVGLRRSSLLRSPTGQLREYLTNQQSSSSFSPSLSPNAESVARRRKSAFQNDSVLSSQLRGASSSYPLSSSPIDDEQYCTGKSSNANDGDSSLANAQISAAPLQRSSFKDEGLGLSNRCLVPVTESTKSIVPLSLVVLLASICDLVSIRSSSMLTLRESRSSTGVSFGINSTAGEQKGLGGVGGSELAEGGSAAHVLWTLSGGDLRGRGAISYKRMRAVMLRETGMDLGCSKSDFLGGGGGAVARNVHGGDRTNAALPKQRLVKILSEEGKIENNGNNSNSVHFVNNKTKGEERREKENQKIVSTFAVQTKAGSPSGANPATASIEPFSSLPTLGDFLMGTNAGTPRAADTTEGSMRTPNNSTGTTAMVSGSQQQQQRHNVSPGTQEATAGASRLESPADTNDPQSDIIFFSEVEAFFEAKSFSRKRDEPPDSNNESASSASACTHDSTIVRRAIASMAAAHEGRRKASGYMSFDEDTMMHRRAKNGSQANQQYHLSGEGGGLIEDHQRETANLTTLLFLEYFYSPALADSPHLQGVSGTNGTVVGPSAAVGDIFSSPPPSSPSHPSFATKSEIPAARAEQKPSSHTVKDRTTIDALGEAIVSTWDTLAVLIGEPSARGKIDNPLDPKAHCLKKALFAFRGLIGVGAGAEGSVAGGQTAKKINSSHSAALQSNKRLQGNRGRKQKISDGTPSKAKTKAKSTGGQDGQVGVALIDLSRNAASDQYSLSLNSNDNSNSNTKSYDGKKDMVIESNTIGGNLMISGLRSLIKSKNEPASRSATAAKDSHSSSTIIKTASPVAPLSTPLREKLPALIRKGTQAIADVDVLLGKLERQQVEDKAAMRMRELAKRHEGGGGGSPNDLEHFSLRKGRRRRRQLEEDSTESPLRRRMEKLRELAAYHGITLENDPRGGSDKGKPTHEASSNRNIDCGVERVELSEGCGKEGSVLSVDFHHDTSRSRIVVPSPGGEAVLRHGADQSLGQRGNDRNAVVLVDASVQTDPVRRPKKKMVDSSALKVP